MGVASRGPVNTPTKVLSYPEAVQVFGDKMDTSVSYLMWDVDLFFRNGGGACWISRISATGIAAADENQLTTTLLKGHAAEESFLAIFLYKINNFKNVIQKATTLVDWARSVGGGSPYTFHDWTAEDEKVVAALRAEKDQNYLFMRKIGATFPDEVLRGHPLAG